MWKLRDIDDDRLVTTSYAAKLLGMKPKTLENWRYEGKGPPFRKLGNRLIRYRVKELKKWSGSDDDGCT